MIPESFAGIVMLYVPSSINGVEHPAFVDSGAQMTVMSAKHAEACGLMRLLDRRFAGIAKGVGTSRILGKVHRAPLKLGPLVLDCSFTILENDGTPFLLGLDSCVFYACAELHIQCSVVSTCAHSRLHIRALPRTQCCAATRRASTSSAMRL